MTPYRNLRSLIGAFAVGCAAAGLVGCQLLPEDSKVAKHFKESKITKHFTESKLAKHFKESKLVKHFKAPEAEIPVMPEIVPPAPTPPPQSALNLAPGAPPPGPPTIWSKLGLAPEQREFRQRAMAETKLGKTVEAISKPLSKMTLGLIPAVKPPPVPTLGQLLDKGAIGAISKVKLDKLNAKKRKEAVDELKTVDCHYWPEAEEALVAALRTDRNEAVRYSAAKALANGKCCTKKTIDALSICASGSDRDGAPCEVSETVRATAAKALTKCLECQCLKRCGVKPGAIPCPDGTGTTTDEKPRDEEEAPRAPVVPASVKPSPYGTEESEESIRHVRMAAYYVKVKQKPDDVVVANAREVLARVKFPPGADAIPAGHPDYEAVELYPGPSLQAEPTETSPRPQGVFDRPSAAIRTSTPAKPRDPSRPANVFDILLSPSSQQQAEPPVPQETAEPPRAPSTARPAKATPPEPPPSPAAARPVPPQPMAPAMPADVRLLNEPPLAPAAPPSVRQVIAPPGPVAPVKPIPVVSEEREN